MTAREAVSRAAISSYLFNRIFDNCMLIRRLFFKRAQAQKLPHNGLDVPHLDDTTMRVKLTI